MYRPQFPWPTPPGYVDQDFSYSFDGNTGITLLSGNLSSGVSIQNIILPLEPDEVFMWRGWKLISFSISFMPFYIQFRDPTGNYLSLAPVPIAHIALPSGATGWGTATVPIEPEIPCPAGSNILCNITNPAPSLTFQLPRVVLYGVKRGPVIEK